MQVLLTHAVPHFGQPGDLVKVRPGFARNYLLPQGLATFATPHNLRIVEKHRQRLRELEEARRADLLNLAAQIAQRSITIEANANAEGHLYGSVNADQIAAALKRRQLPDRRPTTSGSRARSRSWASTRSSSTSARTSTPRSSSGSSRPTPRKPPPEAPAGRPAGPMGPNPSPQGPSKRAGAPIRLDRLDEAVAGVGGGEGGREESPGRSRPGGRQAQRRAEPDRARRRSRQEQEPVGGRPAR